MSVLELVAARGALVSLSVDRLDTEVVLSNRDETLSLGIMNMSWDENKMKKRGEKDQEESKEERVGGVREGVR